MARRLHTEVSAFSMLGFYLSRVAVRVRQIKFCWPPRHSKYSKRPVTGRPSPSGALSLSVLAEVMYRSCLAQI
ncbi:hypothetical protein BDV09DRAFT_166792 [Aspergillus tetrazonus]